MRRFAMNYGIVIGLCLTLMLVIVRLLGISAQVLPLLLNSVFIICSLVYAIMQYRDNVNDGFISYGTTLKLGTLIGFFSSLILAVYSYIQLFYFNGLFLPSFFELVMPLGSVLRGTVSTFFLLIFLILPIMGVWRVYEKANQIGWSCLIPIYNFYILTKIVGKPDWWWLLIFIPFLNLIISIIVLNELSKSFGKSTEYTLGLLFLGFVFYPLLGLSHDEYIGPGGREQDVSSNQII